MELNDIRPAHKPQLKGSQGKPAQEDDVASNLPAGGLVVHTTVKMVSLEGEGVVHPDPLHMDEGGLAFAVDEVLEGRNGEKVVISIHRGVRRMAVPTEETAATVSRRCRLESRGPGPLRRRAAGGDTRGDAWRVPAGPRDPSSRTNRS